MSRWVTQVEWDEVPHLSKETKDELYASIPPYQRDARTKGIPQMGAGAIYPVAEADVVCQPFPIPRFWPKVYGLDVGWNRTAAVWAALDPDADKVFLFSEYYRSQAEPAVHAAAIKARGDWIPGVIDPAAKGRSQVDGRKLIELYSELGLFVDVADNAVESGIQHTLERLSDGRLKVFNTLQNWLSEFRLYRRDDKGDDKSTGKIIKRNDHLMDATRYLVMSGLRIAMAEPSQMGSYESMDSNSTRSAITGY